MTIIALREYISPQTFPFFFNLMQQVGAADCQDGKGEMFRDSFFVLLMYQLHPVDTSQRL